MGPIVRTGTKPDFWENWGKAFGKATVIKKLPAKKPKEKKPKKKLPVSRRLGSGGGFSVSSRETKAIDRYAMERAMQHFKALGFEVERMPQVHPFDLKIRKGRVVRHVEVKGTRTLGEKIILTRNEVEFARENKAKMILFVLHSITLSRDLHPRGGTPFVVEPWNVDTGTATPIQFTYEI